MTAHAKVQGLYLVENVITVEEEASLIGSITQARTLATVGESDVIARLKNGIPSWLTSVWQSLMSSSPVLAEITANCSLPEIIHSHHYTSSDYLNDHIDTTTVYGPWIVGLSLGSATTMQFKRKGVTVDVYLPARSMFIMSEDARYEWTHGIARRAMDVKYIVDQQGIMMVEHYSERKTRWALTFRRFVRADDYNKRVTIEPKGLCSNTSTDTEKLQKTIAIEKGNLATASKIDKVAGDRMKSSEEVDTTQCRCEYNVVSCIIM